MHFQGKQFCQNCFCHPSEKRIYSKRKEIASLNSFLLRNKFFPFNSKREEFAPLNSFLLRRFFFSFLSTRGPIKKLGASHVKI